MRGRKKQQETLFGLKSPGDRVPKDHPLRRVKDMADAALAALTGTFDQMYSGTGRPSIPPEQLLKACLLMAFYTVRSERLFCEQLDYNLLFRWFLDMGIEDPSFDHSTFSQNRQRLLEHDVARKFFMAVMSQAQSAGLTSNEHFSVDGSLIDAWASLKSFRPKGEDDRDEPPPDDKGNPTVNFHGQKRSNATHESTTDPEAKLLRKGLGKEARLSYSLNGVMENRNGLLMDLAVLPADGYAERDAAIMMLEGLSRNSRATVGGDKGYDTADFVADCRKLNVTPHIAQTTDPHRGSAIDGRTTRPSGYALSQRYRKRIEEIWGWMKTVGGFRKTRFRGRERTELAGYLVGAAYNLLRMARLAPA